MTPDSAAPDSDEDDHSCLDNIDILSGCCAVCGEQIDPADALCTWCNRYPCYCDEAYERAKDERMGL